MQQNVTLYAAYSLLYDRTGQSRHSVRMVRYAHNLWQTLGMKPSRLLELACGTGAAALALEKLGYQVHGVDASAQMVAIAQEKARQRNARSVFTRQDLRDLSLDQRFDGATCFYDSLNYLLDPQDLLQALQRAHQHLEPGSPLLCDLLTEQAFARDWGNTTEVREDEDLTRIWRTTFDERSRVSTLKATYFVREGDRYERIEELHRQRGYDPAQIKELLHASGWEPLKAYCCGTTRDALPSDYRVAYLARAR